MNRLLYKLKRIRLLGLILSILISSVFFNIPVWADSTPIFQLPHTGVITTRFSNYHPAIDLATPLGTQIRPIAEGVVKEAGPKSGGYGNVVVVEHIGGYQSMYCHMGAIYAYIGQNVTKDTVLGTVGLTGWTTGPHTHLEISKNGTKIDPLTVLPPIIAPTVKTAAAVGGPKVVAASNITVKSLPKTGVPLPFTALIVIIPLAFKLRRFGIGTQKLAYANNLWERRQLQK